MKKNFFAVLFSFVLLCMGICCSNKVEASEFTSRNVWAYLLENNSYTIKSGADNYECYQQTKNSCNYNFSYEYQMEFSNPSVGGTYLFYGVSNPVDIEYYDLTGSFPSINDRFVVEKYQFNGEFSRVSSHIQANSTGTFTINEKGVYKIYTGEVSFHQTIYLIYETDFVSMNIEDVEFINDSTSPSLAARIVIENPNDVNASSSNVTFKVNNETLPVYYVEQVDTGVNNSYVVTVVASLADSSNKVVKNGTIQITVNNNTREHSNINYDVEKPILTSITYFNKELQDDEFGLGYTEGITLNYNPNGLVVKLIINESSSIKSVEMNNIACTVDNETKIAVCNINTGMYESIPTTGLMYKVVDEFDNSVEVYHDAISFEENTLESIEIESDEEGYIKVKGTNSNISEICLFYGGESWLDIKKFECGSRQVKPSYTYTGDVQVVVFNNNLLYKAIELEGVTLSNDKNYLDTPVTVTVNSLGNDEFSILDSVNELPKVACGLTDNDCQEEGTWQIVYKRHTQEDSDNLLVEDFKQIEVTTFNFLELLNNKIRISQAAYEQFDLDVFVVFNYVVGSTKQSISKQHTIIDELPRITDQDKLTLSFGDVFIEYGEFEATSTNTKLDLYENDMYVNVIPAVHGTLAKIVSRVVAYVDLNGNSVEVSHTGMMSHEYLQQNLNLGKYILECRVEIKQDDQSVVYTKSFFRNIFVQDTIMPVLAPLANKLVEVKQYDVYKDSLPKCSDATGCKVNVTYYFGGTEVEKIDTDKVGTYTIKYVAVDGAGNESFEETKTIVIIGINALDTTSILIIVGIVVFFGGLVAVAIILEVNKNKKQKNIK